MGADAQEDPAHRAGSSWAIGQDRAGHGYGPAWPRRVGGVSSRPIYDPRELLVPFKAHAAGRHHIPKQRYRVTNWAEYDASLRQRGSLTVWFSDDAIAAWRAAPRTTRGGQPRSSPLAITTALTLRAVFRLALRQTEGLIGSILHPCSASSLPCRTTRHSTAGPRPWRCRVLGPAPAPVPCTCWWTAPASSWAALAHGGPRSTAPGNAAPGASCTWAWTPPPARSKRCS